MDHAHRSLGLMTKGTISFVGNDRNLNYDGLCADGDDHYSIHYGKMAHENIRGKGVPR